MFTPGAMLDTSQVQSGPYGVCPVMHTTAAQHVAWLGWHLWYVLAAVLILSLFYVVADEGWKALRMHMRGGDR